MTSDPVFTFMFSYGRPPSFGSSARFAGKGRRLHPRCFVLFFLFFPVYPLLRFYDISLKKQFYLSLREENRETLPPKRFVWQTYHPTVSCAEGLIFSLQILSSPEADNIDTESRCKDDGKKICSSCYGFLLRDGALVTSVECAEMAGKAPLLTVSNHRTEFLAATKSEIIQMTVGGPMMSNSERKARSRSAGATLVVGLVKFDLPTYHRRRSGPPRLRMFLNADGSSNNENLSSAPLFRLSRSRSAFSVSCLNKTPILSIYFFREGQMQRTYFDSAGGHGSSVAKSMFWVTNDTAGDSIAEMTNGHGERWWVRKDTKAVLEQKMQDIIDEYRQGSVGSLHTMVGGVPRRNTSLEEVQPLHVTVGGVLQVEDPTGGRKDTCLKKYFDRWMREIPFSGEPFFEWLDFGSGENVTHRSCSREELNNDQHHLEYFNATEREKTAVVLQVSDGGKILRATFNKTSLPVPNGRYEFVWGLDERVYVAKVKHTVFFRAKPVLMAGEMAFGNDGILLCIRPSSGRYKPELKHMVRFDRFLRRMGFHYKRIDWKRMTPFVEEHIPDFFLSDERCCSC